VSEQETFLFFFETTSVEDTVADSSMLLDQCSWSHIHRTS